LSRLRLAVQDDPPTQRRAVDREGAFLADEAASVVV
jgi:hypothetical protein